MAADFNRIAAAALDALLDAGERSADRPVEGRRRFGRAGPIALGIGLGIAARAIYERAREVDLEQLAGAVEKKLKG